MIYERGNGLQPKYRLWGWPALLIAIWMMVLLYMPFVEKTWGKGGFHNSISLSVLIQSAIVIFLMARGMGIKGMAIILGKVILLTWAIEAIGIATKFPFGSYEYTDVLQPQFNSQAFPDA